MKLGRQASNPATEPVQEEFAVRRRNRLSKLLTNKTSTSISTTGLHESVSRSKIATTTTSHAPGGPLSSNPSHSGLRQKIRSQVFNSDQQSPSQSLKSDSTWSVAYVVSQLDANSAERSSSQLQQPSPSPLKPKKRKSLVLRRLSLRRSTSLTYSASNGEAGSSTSEAIAASTPTSSLDQIIDSPSAPPTRRASFTPGTATRKPSRTFPENGIQEENVVEERAQPSTVAAGYDEWVPPPPRTDGRAGTPADLEYSYLGGLRHGSLQIVNGRASPALSEVSRLSRPLLSAPKPHRDVSSDYGDADEEWEAVTSLESSSPVPTADSNIERYNYRHQSNDEKRLRPHPLQTVISSEHEPLSEKDGDQTSLMAKEYMAELAESPFSECKSGSLPGSVRRTTSEGSLQISPSSSSQQGDRPYLTPSPTGSVVRRSIPDRDSGVSSASFQGAPTSDERQSCESEMTWYSPRPSQDEAFESALEFPVAASPTRLQPPHRPEKSDSGYSSSHSLLSMQMVKNSPHAKTQVLRDTPAAILNVGQKGPELKPSYLVHRPPILKSHKTEVTLPTLHKLRPNLVSSTSAPAVPTLETTPTKPTKGRKKLQKKNPLRRPPGKIAVTRVRSFDGESVPQIPTEIRENLRIRSQEVPELERTYASLDPTAHQASTSNINLYCTEIRFPSPSPEPSMRISGPRNRSRSRSRPRSWIGLSREDNSSSRRNSGSIQPQAIAIINDFGTTGLSLGDGPYDLAHGRPEPERTTNSGKRTLKAPRPWSMMDDETAAELARLRTRTMQERENMFGNRKAPFNDRGGVPGKNLRAASFAADAPPITPEMLRKAYRTTSEHASTGDGIAPPPPPHSPRPSYIDYEEDYSQMAFAPPPPSHSPRPMTTADPCSWTPQASRWGDPRSAARGFRRQSWNHHYVDQYDDVLDEEPLYPEIPPRNDPGHGWAQYRSTEEYSHPHQVYNQGYNDVHYGHTYSEQPDQYSKGPSNEHWYDDKPAYTQPCGRNSRMAEHQSSRERTEYYVEPVRHRPLPSPRPNVPVMNNNPPRPHSQATSVRSCVSSLAEELHPSDIGRSYPPPAFGRYSGGLGYDYERENGFGGSAGTRSVSGKAEATRREVPMRASFGIDLGDVPMMAMARC